jgi:hypothetical protein
MWSYTEKKDMSADDEPSTKRHKPFVTAKRVELNCRKPRGKAIVFVRGPYSQYAQGHANRGGVVDSELHDNRVMYHEDRTPMSLCSQYITWLNPGRVLDKNTLHSLRNIIELWQDGDTLYFSTSEGANPPWTRAEPQLHDRVLSYLTPAEQILIERTSKGIRNLGQHGSPLCAELKFAVPNSHDQFQGIKTRILALLTHTTQLGPGVPRCPNGIGTVTFLNQLDSMHMIRELFDDPEFVGTLMRSTKRIRFSGELHDSLFRMVTHTMESVNPTWPGLLIVDNLLLYPYSITFYGRYETAIRFLIGRIIITDEADARLPNAETYNVLLQYVHTLTPDVHQEINTLTDFGTLVQAPDMKKFVTTADTWNREFEQRPEVQAVLRGATLIRDRADWWAGDRTDFDRAVLTGAISIRGARRDPVDVDEVD